MSVKGEWLRIRNEANDWRYKWDQYTEVVSVDVEDIKWNNQSLLFSNARDYSPVFLYCPKLKPTMKSYRNIRDIDKLWIVAKENLGGYGNTPVIWRMEAASNKFTSCHFRGRGQFPSNISLRFMYCLTKKLSTLGQLSETSKIAWIAVVPSKHSVKFHKDFISSKEIDPEKYGIEFWYNPEAINLNRTLKKLFGSFIKEQLGKLGLRAIRKTEEEMNSLLQPLPSFIPSHKTPGEAKSWCGDMFKRVITGQAPTVPAQNLDGAIDEVEILAQGVQVRNDHQYVIGIDLIA